MAQATAVGNVLRHGFGNFLFCGSSTTVYLLPVLIEGTLTMSKFISGVLMFLAPLFLLGVSMEILLRNIPNDYTYKKGYLDERSDNIEVLFLGSSHAFFDINPVYIKSNSFNASYVSQPLDYDYEILKKYDGHWSRLRTIVIPIS